MAQFYASIKGSRGEATRMGTKQSGIAGHLRGWNIGGKVECWYEEETDSDMVAFYVTRGSNNGEGILLGIYKLDSAGNIIKQERESGE